MHGPPEVHGRRVPGPEPTAHGLLKPGRDAAPALLAIVGPTGTGKSALALALADALDAEIVGCDALQVYRGFDAATAKPDALARERVPHHLIDCRDPRRDFSVADFVAAAEGAIGAIAARGRVPLVVGGTGLYLRGLLRGIVGDMSSDRVLRRRLRAMLERRGPERLHRWLLRLDPPSAARIHPRDGQRVVRALELAVAGRPWSGRLEGEGTWADARERYPNLKFGLDLDRQRLATRLELRVRQFFEAGLVEEVSRLLAAGVPREANAFKAIGYREVLAALDEGTPLDAVRDRIRRNTVRYSKRQRSWFRKEPGVVWLDASLPDGEHVRRITDAWRRFTRR